MNIDRRRLLGSLAATTACVPVASSINAAGFAARGDANNESQSYETLFLAREVLQKPSIVDFWMRPFCDIAYEQYLPREIARGKMWYEALGQPDRSTSEAIDRSIKYHCRAWAGRPQMAAHVDCIQTFSSTLRTLIEDEAANSTARTAFLSLDSLGPSREPNWAEVLPAFRSCYDRVVGHFHLPQRGLRQWRKFLNGHFHSESGRGYFAEFFTDAAVQCDVVILTSTALVESDLSCCPRASVEELVSELMGHLGRALMAPAALERIVGAHEHRVGEPRFFALASLALETMDNSCGLVMRRQAELVRGAFGDQIPGQHPLHVATTAEDMRSHLLNHISEANMVSLFPTAASTNEIEKRQHGNLDQLQLLTLWPFEFNETKLRST